MSYRTAERVPLSEKNPIFSGGYSDNVSNFDLEPNKSPYLRNCRLDGANIVIRQGHDLLSTLTAGSYPKGIGSYLRTVDANSRLIVRHNTDATHKLYTITDAGVATSIDTGANIASDLKMRFQNVADVVYCMNGSDNFGMLSGTTYSLPSTGVTNFAPAFSVIFNSSHFASGWSTNPNTVYKSVGDDYDDFNSTGSDTFTFPETVTGLAVNNEALFYFTKNTVSTTASNDITDTAGTITYVTRALEVKEGAVNHDCIVAAGNMVYFVTPSNKISMVARGKNIDGFEVMELSTRKYKGIDNIMSTLAADQTLNAWGEYYPKDNLIKWFFKKDGSSINDICIIYDIGKDTFLVDDGKYFFDGTAFKGNNYTVSMVEPKVYKDEYGLDDEGGAIPFEYRTKEYYISDPTFKKVFWETRTLLDINMLASLTQEIWIDESQADVKVVDSDNMTAPGTGGIGTESIGVFAIGTDGEYTDDDDSDYEEITILRTKGNLNKRGRKIQFRFTNQVVGSKVRLKNITARVEVLNELTNNLTT